MAETRKSLRAIFDEASEISDAEQRRTYLDQACGGNAALRVEVEELLRAQETAGGFLADPKREAPVTASEVTEQEGDGIGRYKLLQKIGEGGCGVVYMAEQTEPVKRRVALKVIKLGMDTRSVVARFEAERQALALMDHPCVARVLDAGTTDTGRPYFVMELVRGIKITDYCDQNHLSTTARLQLFIQVCQAVQHAHQKGIIHRDLKPSNILVTSNDGVPLPKVIDFGIAKATADIQLTDKTLFTRYEMFIGTPAYMSPEQAGFNASDIDTRTDIYALGVLLYELLTGQTPFDANELMSQSLDAMRKAIREKEPPKPSTRLTRELATAGTTRRKSIHGLAIPTQEELENEDRRCKRLREQITCVRGDLDWIVMKCLEKDRTRRYETANGLAMDLKRHLNNETVVARPPSSVYRFQKLVRRNKLAFAAVGAVACALFLGIIATTWQAIRATHAKQQALAAQASEKVLRQKAEANAEKAIAAQKAQAEAELVARQRAYASDMNLAQQALDGDNLGGALELLNRERPQPGQTDLRGWEWRYLWGQTRSDAVFTLCRESNTIISLAVSPDGHWLAVSDAEPGGLSVWDLQKRQETLRLAKQEEVTCAAFSPTTNWLAFASVRHSTSEAPQFTLHLWNTATRRLIGEYPLDGRCVGLAFSKDGQTLVTSTSFRGAITLWHLPDGTRLASYPSGQGFYGSAYAAFAATPDLSLVAYGSTNPQIRLVNMQDGRELWHDEASVGFLQTLAFSPDGKTLAIAGGPDIRLWEVATGKEIGRLKGHVAPVCSLVFLPDGKLVSGSADQTIRVWDVVGRKCLEVLRGHRDQVWRLALLPDGKTLVSGCKDGTVCLWDTSVPHPRPDSLTIPGSVDAWCFAAGGQSILTAGRGGVTRWTGANFQQSEPLPELGTNPLANPVFSHDGRFLASVSTNGVIQIWDIRRRTLRCRLTNVTGSTPLEFFDDGNGLVTRTHIALSSGYAWSHDTLDAWNLVTGRKTYSWKVPLGPVEFKRVAVSPDAQQLIGFVQSGGSFGVNLDNGSERKLDLNVPQVTDAAWSPDGGLFAASSRTEIARVWDTATWHGRTLGGNLDGVTSVAFSPDGKRLAIGTAQEALRLWDINGWQVVFNFKGEGTGLHTLAFSPDGNVIGAIDATGTLHLWRAPSWAEIRAAEAKNRTKAQRP